MNLIVSKANEALVAPSTAGVMNLFPDAPTLPDGNVVIPHGMRETLLLRHLGFKVPNPILMYYDWKGGHPYECQKQTVRLLTEHSRAYVLNDMGTGKTKTVLWAWDALREAGLVGKLLVVAPLSTLNFVWAREVHETLRGPRVQVLHGTRQDRLDRLAQDADVYIINHDGLKTIAEALSVRPDITCLVLDELAVYRNNSDRSKLMRKFAQRFQIVWGLTGSPMPNAPTDVWAQCKIITPNSVPQYFTHARTMLMTQVSQHKWKPQTDAVEKAFKMMQPSVRYKLEDVAELPPMIERTVKVDLSDEQNSTYYKVQQTLTAMIRGGQITAVNAAAAMGKLLQVAGGWVYTHDGKYVRLDAAPRIVALYDLIQSTDRKAIVFIPYRHMIDGISQIFSNPKVMKVDHCVVHGDTKNREEIFTTFQNTDKYRVMLAHPQTVHHGLTLTAADTNIWYLPTANLEQFEQANRRIRRIGQKHKQQLLMMSATPVETRLYRILHGKKITQDQLLALLEEASGENDGNEF